MQRHGYDQRVAPTARRLHRDSADYPKDSSLRGTYDEERQLCEELFSLNQACDCRWIEVWGRESRQAEMRSNARRFGCGRIVVSSSATAGAATNQWLNGELAIYGRSIGPNEGMDGAPVATLPKTTSLLIPEPESPESWSSGHILSCCLATLWFDSPAPMFGLLRATLTCYLAVLSSRTRCASLKDCGQAWNRLPRRKAQSALKCSSARRFEVASFAPCAS